MADAHSRRSGTLCVPIWAISVSPRHTYESHDVNSIVLLAQLDDPESPEGVDMNHAIINTILERAEHDE